MFAIKFREAGTYRLKEGNSKKEVCNETGKTQETQIRCQKKNKRFVKNSTLQRKT